MKKSLLLAIIISFSFQGFSQDEKEVEVPKALEKTEKVKEKWSASNGIKYGIRGGYTISNLDFETDFDIENKHRNSIYIGFTANIGLTRTLSVVPEIQFSAEGAKSEALHLDYIQMPVLLRFRFSERFHLGVGPQIGLKVHKEDDGFQNLAYSGAIGADYKINYAIFVDIRYNYGLSNVFDEITNIEAKNRTFQLGVGYKF